MRTHLIQTRIHTKGKYVMRTNPKYLAATAALAMAALVVFARSTSAQSAGGPTPSVASTDDNASPIYGVTIRPGYRQWELIAPSHEAILDELRGIRAFSETMWR
jgi:hypothetical protein